MVQKSENYKETRILCFPDFAFSLNHMPTCWDNFVAGLHQPDIELRWNWQNFLWYCKVHMHKEDFLSVQNFVTLNFSCIHNVQYTKKKGWTLVRAQNLFSPWSCLKLVIKGQTWAKSIIMFKGTCIVWHPSHTSSSM